MVTAAEILKIGPEDHGRRMTLKEYIEAETVDGWLYELARGTVVVTEVPDPGHGMIIMHLDQLLQLYDGRHELIKYLGSRATCRICLPGMVSHRAPDRAIYLHSPPKGANVWQRWMPQIAVEIVWEDSHERDYVEKREEYLYAGVTEYWIIDPFARSMLVLKRNGDTWHEIPYQEDGVHRTELLPGLEVKLADLLIPMPYDDEDHEPRPAPEG